MLCRLVDEPRVNTKPGFGFDTRSPFSFSGGGLWIWLEPIQQKLRSTLTVFQKMVSY